MNPTVMNIRIILTGALLALTSLTCALSAQVDGLGLRTNVLSWAVLSPSLGVDISWNGRYMAVIDGSYGDWNISESSSNAIRLSSIGVGARRYFGEDYFGWYAGVDARYLRFNTLKSETNREGNMYTAGLLAGYTFKLWENWTLDTSIGAGYVHRKYDRYKYYPPAEEYRGLGIRKMNGLGLTNLSVSLAYRFKL